MAAGFTSEDYINPTRGETPIRPSTSESGITVSTTTLDYSMASNLSSLFLGESPSEPFMQEQDSDASSLSPTSSPRLTRKRMIHTNVTVAKELTLYIDEILSPIKSILSPVTENSRDLKLRLISSPLQKTSYWTFYCSDQTLALPVSSQYSEWLVDESLAELSSSSKSTSQ